MEFSCIALPTTFRDSPFATNLASLPRLPINTSYASSTSISISGMNTLPVLSGVNTVLPIKIQ